ncbi:MAG: hypothetical protein HYT08_05180 [Candidatus Levybacteria bacterium]|nr:hypothetical protein [Candidatus Levybacteria bacterium]
MQSHEREKRLPVGFDIEKIAENLRGWELRQFSFMREEGEWQLYRVVSDDNVSLEMKPAKRYVCLRAATGRHFSTNANIFCRNIESVNISKGEVEFKGDVNLIVRTYSFEVRLPDAPREDAIIVHFTP